VITFEKKKIYIDFHDHEKNTKMKIIMKVNLAKGKNKQILNYEYTFY
jgi:hypothetical protein